jgi:hypothetical protein
MEFSKDSIIQIVIDIDVESESILSMRIHKDGTLQRKGNGNIPPIGIAAIGMTDGGVFRKLIDLLHEGILQHAGTYEQIEQTGTPVTYRIVFMGEKPNFRILEFRISSDSDNCGVIFKYMVGYVQAAIQWTDKWYHQALVENKVITNPETAIRCAGPKQPWWLFGKLVR